MSEDTHREILEELKKINQRLDIISEQRGITTPLKIVAVIFGFAILGPAIAFLVTFFTRFLS